MAMQYVLNLNTKMLSPLPSGPGDISTFIPPNAIIIDEALAAKVSKADMAGRERIVTAILGKRLMNNVAMTPEAKRILEAGVGALKVDLGELSEEATVVESNAQDSASSGAEVSGSALLTRRQISRLTQADLVKYARDTLGLTISDEDPPEVVKAQVIAKQFHEE